MPRVQSLEKMLKALKNALLSARKPLETTNYGSFNLMELKFSLKKCGKLFLFFTLSFFTGCVFLDKATVIIENKSGGPLQEVKIDYPGGQDILGMIQSGEVKKTHFKIHSEGNIEITYQNSSGQLVTKEINGYVTTDTKYSFNVVFEPGDLVVVDTQIGTKTSDAENQVLQAVNIYCTLDGLGVQYTSGTWKYLQEVAVWEDGPGWDGGYVIDTFLIGKPIVTQDKASVPVKYHIIAEVEGEQVSTDLDRSETVDYKLERKDGVWKITEPQLAPHFLKAFVAGLRVDSWEGSAPSRLIHFFQQRNH